MRFALFPLVVVFFLTSHFLLATSRSRASMPSTTALASSQSGQMFVAYRDAVLTYSSANPAFMGSVSDAQLATQGTPFPTSFTGSAGNVITTTGAAGRIITVYANLPAGALASAASSTSSDASLGTSNGSYWTSIGPGATPQSLATVVPSGYTVSVNQIGK
jgi:hypothetical protein